MSATPHPQPTAKPKRFYVYVLDKNFISTGKIRRSDIHTIDSEGTAEVYDISLSDSDLACHGVEVYRSLTEFKAGEWFTTEYEAYIAGRKILNNKIADAQDVIKSIQSIIAILDDNPVNPNHKNNFNSIGYPASVGKNSI